MNDNNKSLWLRTNLYWLILLVVLVFVTYANSIPNKFVSDDIQGIVQNSHIGSLESFRTKPLNVVQNLLDFVIIKTAGLSAPLFRLTNILFHLGSVITLFFIITILLPGSPAAFFAASLFAVHPVLSEPVVWISGSPYTQSVFFILVSFLFYIQKLPSRLPYFGSLIFFLLAVTTSEKAFIFPLMLVIYELINDKHGTREWKKIIPFFIFSGLWGALLFFHLSVYQEVLQVQHGMAKGMYNPLIQIPVAISSYLRLFVWPGQLSLYHTDVQLSIIQYLSHLAVFSAFLSAWIWSWFKNRMIFFWLSFFIISLSPTLTPFRVSWIVAERYAYLGFVGIIVAFAIVLAHLFKKKKYKTVVFVFFSIVIMLLSARTIVRNADWKDQDTLFLSLGKTAPLDPKTHNNLGDYYSRHGDLRSAAASFSRAIELNPNYAHAIHNLANTYQEMNRPDLAVPLYQQALKINPTLWQSYQNMAGAFYSLNKFDEAEKMMQKAIRMNPNEPRLYAGLGTLYLAEQKKDLARAAFEKALSLDPQNKSALSGMAQLR